MKIFIAFLYVIAAVLPYLGARRLWLKATADARAIRQAERTVTGEGASYDQVETAMEVLVPALEEGGDASGRDLWLIGGGLAFGAIASIWSLCL
jgi:hypothetical protein